MQAAEIDFPFERVLVVDDDALLLVIAEAYLKHRGAHEVLSVTNGNAALDMIAEQGSAIDLVLLDLNMPDGDGVRFIRKIAEMNYAGSLIISSGEDRKILQTAAAIAEQSGVRILGTIEKPFEPAKFEAVLENMKVEERPSSTSCPERAGFDQVREALQLGEIGPVFQPKVHGRTGQVVGAEALARWLTKTGPCQSPAAFLPSLIEGGLEPQLFETMLRQSLFHSVRWRANGITVPVSVNVDAGSLSDADFPDRVREILDECGAQGSALVIEVTENNFLHKLGPHMETLIRLRMMGIGISIDDFGTGFSNLDRLSAFPFDELKIDRSFVQNAREDAMARACIDACVAMGKTAGFKVIAEGVETDAELSMILERGVEVIQGFYFAKPMTASDFLPFCKAGAAERQQLQTG